MSDVLMDIVLDDEELNVEIQLVDDAITLEIETDVVVDAVIQYDMEYGSDTLID